MFNSATPLSFGALFRGRLIDGKTSLAGTGDHIIAAGQHVVD